MIEYRVCWSASSNASFFGQTDWDKYTGDAADPDTVMAHIIGSSSGGVDEAMEVALEASGFECWVELRRDGESWS